MSLRQKLSRLEGIIRGYNSCLVAFSGGVDSTFLLRVCAGVLPRDKLLAVTANSATYPKDELSFSRKISGELGVRHEVIKSHELANKTFISNPIDRCFFCKKELFGRLKTIAAKNNLSFVIDAANLSDKLDFRPGEKAKKGLRIRSPLAEAGFKKEEIRKLSRQLGLVSWDKPSLACLASRVPYGIRISPGILRRIDKGEAYLRNLGFKQARLRHYNHICRIEVLKNEIPRLISMSNRVVKKLKKIGYNYVTVDLEGYRTGSLNEVIDL